MTQRLARAVREAQRRVSRHVHALLLAATAAALSYWLASFLFGAEEAFFAPIAAVVCVGLTAGQRTRRAGEIAIGVAVGLTAADLLVRLIGAGALQLGVAVLLAMGVATALGASTLMVNQAAVAAVLVVALAPGASNPLIRLGDAFIGGAVALGLNALAGPDPQRLVRRATHEVLDDLAGTVTDIAAALSAHDFPRAEGALVRAMGVASSLDDLDAALATARESARLARRRRQFRREVRAVMLVRGRLDLLIGTARALARAAGGSVRHGQDVDRRLVLAVEGLAASILELQRWIEGVAHADAVRRRAVQAAADASVLLHGPHPHAISVLVGQVRSAAVDVLRATGLDQRSAVSQVEAAAGQADRLGPT